MPVSAQGASYEYCIACTGPQAIYLCTVGPRSPDPGAAAWASYCEQRVRSDVGHAACSAQPLGQDCRATRAFVFRGPRATPAQAEALTSPVPDERRSAAAEIWDETLESMRGVGQTVEEGASAAGRSVEEGAQVVGETARSVGENVWDGLKAVGEGVSRGTECVITLGESC